MTKLASDDEMRHELTRLHLDDLAPEARHRLVPLITRLLLAKLHKTRGKQGRDLGSKRSQIFDLFAEMTVAELVGLFNIILGSYGLTLQSSYEQTLSALAQSSFSSHVRFLFVLESVIRNMGSVVCHDDMLPGLLQPLIAILELSTTFNDQLKVDDPHHRGRSQAKEVAKTVYKRVFELYSKLFYVQYVTGQFTAMFVGQVMPRVERFAVDKFQSKSALLDIFVLWSRQPHTMPLLLEYPVLAHITSMLAVEAKNDKGEPLLGADVAGSVLEMVYNLCCASCQTPSELRNDIMKLISQDEAEIESTPVATDILRANITTTIDDLGKFLSLHWSDIHDGLVTKQRVIKTS